MWLVSFVQTHSVVAKLLKHADFSPIQIEQLVQIAQTNDEVGWIIGDTDVHAFYASLLKHEDSLSPDVAAQLKAVVQKGEKEVPPAPSKTPWRRF
jgi:fibrillarin-like rRNA methylase